MKTSAFLKEMSKIWLDIGNYMVQLIRKDFAEGKFQNDLSGLQYNSKQYKKYKSLGMKRLTLGEGKLYSSKVGEAGGSAYYRTGRLFTHNKSALRYKKGGGQSLKTKTYSKGQRLAEYAGQSIESTTTTFVDMTLTGETKKGLHVDKAEYNGVWLAYRPADTQKILNNAQKYGRQVFGLSTENKKLCEELLINRLNKHLKEQVKTINITWKF
jgi:hypothetical protein